MKKNLKIVSLAAAALLAVSPIAAAVSPVNAAKTAQKSKKKTNKVKLINASDVKANETPYFSEKGKEVTSGSISLNKENTVSAIVKTIESKYSIRVNSNTQVRWDEKALTQAVEASLQAASITVNKGTFAAPANSFNVTVTVNYGPANATKTMQMPISVSAYHAPADYSANPVITYHGKKYNHSQNISLASDASFNYVPVNGTVNTAAISNAFKAQISWTDSDATSVKVDTSKVNTAVAGQYDVTVTATNPAGHSTVLTFKLTVGEKGATYKKVNAATPVYTINGNTVTQTSETIPAGQSVATFGTLTLNGVSYTRISGGRFILTSALNAPVKKATTSKRIMHKAVAYDQNGQKAGKTYKFGRKVTVDSSKVNINGSSYYHIAGTDYYVKATNIDGTKRTLKRRAYVYKSSRKKAQRRALKKGRKVRTYGGSYKFKNGKRYYRIGLGKRFVRTSNFR